MNNWLDSVKVEWDETTVMVCDSCKKPMFPNLSTWDDDGCVWICTTPDCSEWSGGELEPEDLVAVGCPPWIALRVAELADKLLELGA